eukprot:Hpha_TRINITY_DN35251_c0_g1::TRINITY_DN35251_c0_g1_i1::g.145135::m.145135
MGSARWTVTVSARGRRVVQLRRLPPPPPPPPPPRTLSDLLSEAREEERRREEEAAETKIEFSSATDLVKAKRNAVMTPTLDHRNLKTFILAKTHGRDRYVRTNPPWIAEHLLAKMRALLMRLRDETVCIDYHVRRVRSDCIAPPEAATFRPKYESEAYTNWYNPEGDREAASLVSGGGNLNHTMGASPATMPYGQARARNASYRTKFGYMLSDAAIGDKRVIDRTLDCFPFPRLRAHGAGEILFTEALNYFVYEMKCGVQKSWQDKSGGELTDYAELALPSAWSWQGVPNVPQINRKVKRNWNILKRNRVLNYWLGSFLRPTDPMYGNIRTGKPFTGFRQWGSG